MDCNEVNDNENDNEHLIIGDTLKIKKIVPHQDEGLIDYILFEKEGKEIRISGAYGEGMYISLESDEEELLKWCS